MKKWIKNLVPKLILMKVLNICAFITAVYSVNATCLWAHQQPEVPTEAMKHRKF